MLLFHEEEKSDPHIHKSYDKQANRDIIWYLETLLTFGENQELNIKPEKQESKKSDVLNEFPSFLSELVISDIDLKHNLAVVELVLMLDDDQHAVPLVDLQKNHYISQVKFYQQ